MIASHISTCLAECFDLLHRHRLDLKERLAPLSDYFRQVFFQPRINLFRMDAGMTMERPAQHGTRKPDDLGDLLQLKVENVYKDSQAVPVLFCHIRRIGCSGQVHGFISEIRFTID